MSGNLKKRVLCCLSALGWTTLAALTVFLFARGFLRRPHIDIEDVAPGVTFDFPVHVAFLGQGTDFKFVIAERAGRVRWARPNSSRVEGEVLDLTSQVYSSGIEEGLLSLAFDPKFPSRPYLYVFYSLDAPKRSVVMRFTVNDRLVADPRSGLKILEIAKLQDSHNGGLLLFDRHGMLFVSVGDSGVGQTSEQGTQILQRKTRLGSILRIDVSNASAKRPYAIPPDNPYVNSEDGSLPEIWANGFRNPWRFSEDVLTDSLIVADVGAEAREEVTQVRRGEFHGWPLVEGEVCHQRSFGSCEQQNIVKPLASIPRNIAVSLTGAAIYRGNAVPALKGRVVLSDYIRGIFSFPYTPGSTVFEVRLDVYKWPTMRGPHVGALYATSSLTVGPDEEIYLVNARGTLRRIRTITAWKWLRGFLYEMLSFS
ncbi:PQQ-dependent sugar dehydrogenase [bacterium]|nr:PQQ-dependent sugar dehydrogenase [bacterium]